MLIRLVLGAIPRGGAKHLKATTSVIMAGMDAWLNGERQELWAKLQGSAWTKPKRGGGQGSSGSGYNTMSGKSCNGLSTTIS